MAAAVMLLASPLAAQTQTRAVTGRVTAAGSGEPVPSAIITVDGRPGVGTQTNEQGNFRLLVPTGDVSLVVRMIGYKRAQVAVPASQETVAIELERDILRLEGMVVTGAATVIERQNATTAVTVVQAEDLNRVPSQSLESALQGKVPGALINLNSGAPGGGGQIQIRGVTSILGNSEPLFVVDGVIMSNAAIQGGLTAVTGAGANQDNPVNRLADINPADIASIEILKGAAASAIYGSKATNGVVNITTKRGAVGKPRYSVTQRFGRSEPAKLLGSRRFESADALVAAMVDPLKPTATKADTAAYNKAVALYRDNFQAPYFDYQKDLYGQRDLSHETGVSVSGGTENTKYYVAATNKFDAGTLINTNARRQDIRINLDQSLGSRVNAIVSTGFIRNIANRGISNNNNSANTSPFYLFGYSPAVINLNTRDANGNFPMNPFAGGGATSSNPFQTLSYFKNQSDVYRWIGAGRLNFSALTTDRHTVTISAIGGLDWYNEDDQVYSPNFLQYEQTAGRNGRVQEQNVLSRQINSSLNAVWTYSPDKSGILGFLTSATTSAGLQFEERNSNRYSVRAYNLIPGVSNINQGIVTPVQVRAAVVDQAYYGQEELLAFDSRLMLQAAVRAERSSANGHRDKYYFFPKAAGSFRFPSPIGGVDEVKVRAAVGTSGNQPRYGDRDLVLSANGQIGGQNALRAAATLGNPDIKPETMTEQEYGVDASFLGQRLAIEATRFDRTITDMLLTAPLPPSSGLAQQVINGGKMTSVGWELAATFTPIRSRSLTWISRNSFYKVEQKIVSLPVPQFRAPSTGFGSAYGDAYITEGYSTTAIWGNKKAPDGSYKLTALGDATPKFTMQFGNSVLWKAWSLNVVTDWKNGGVMSNLTQSLFDEGKNSWDYDHKAPNGDPRPLGQYRYEMWDNGHEASVYLQDASFVKLREITVGYEVPHSFVQRIGGPMQSMRLSLTGRNLYTWSSYWGMDPEVSNFGNNAVARIVDLAPYPPTRSFFFNINVGF